jgi:Amt family ammonium transporter
MRRTFVAGLGLCLLATLLAPAAALAQDAPDPTVIKGELDLTWVILATVLVFFMQAGFLLLEIGFSRGKNVGAGVAKILANFSIATIAWWGLGFGVAFGGFGVFAGDSGFFPSFGDEVGGVAGDLYGETFGGGTSAFFVFQFMFCAVSLAIVWGTTLERIKFIAYPIFAVVFAGVIYPLIAHWGFGGGLFSADNFIGNGVQDFAGSSVVHLTGAPGRSRATTCRSSASAS